MDNTTTSPPPSPQLDNTTSSPPPPDKKDTPAPAPSPPLKSPPPPDSSPPPPPPAKSPPPEKTQSPPPPPEEKSSPPPPKEKSTPAPPPDEKSPTPKKAPPPSHKSPAAAPPPANSPPSPPAAATPSPANSTPAVSSPPPPTSSTIPSPPSREGSPPTMSPPAPPMEAGELAPPPLSTSSRSGGASPPAPSSSSSSSSMNVGVIAVAALVGVGILAAVVICLVCAAKKKKKKQYYVDDPVGAREKGDYYNGSNWNTPQNIRPPPGMMGTPPGWAAAGGYSGSESGGGGYSGQYPNPMSTPSPNMALSNQSSFSYEELAQATNGFSHENILGQGGFGYVHKGVLPSGKEVAVKSLKFGSGQGDREFQAEVDIISRVHHRHLVSLVGYCIVDEQRMLVYEFVPNKTMEFHLHGKGQPVMDWPTRLRIALGAAKGLGYLHEDCHPRIIHRDIKAANILLDFNFEAMVADFGLAKLTSDTSTHVSTRVMGTFGYMAPEYASSGKLTDKSDVFSYGVMLLELITGRKPIDLTCQIMEDSLVDWARPILGRVLESGNYEELVDPRLENNFDPNEMNRMIACAAASIRHSARRRPKMTQIVRSLEGDQSSLEDTAIRSGQTPETSTYDTTAYNADMMKFKKMVMNSNDYGSSEFEQTNEYGLHSSNPSSSELSSREFPNSGPHRKIIL